MPQKKDVVLSIRIPRELLLRVKAICRVMGEVDGLKAVPIAHLLRMFIRDGVEGLEE